VPDARRRYLRRKRILDVGVSCVGLVVTAPVMAVIPRVDGWGRSETAELVTREEPGAPASEAYRTLATNVRFLRSQQPLRILVVTSAMPAEGKSATAANLAVILAETGLRTVLVDADLRRPRASRFIGVPEHAGLREALDGTRDLVDVIQATTMYTNTSSPSATQ